MGDFVDIDCINQNMPVANHRHHKQDLTMFELFVGNPSTSEFPMLHIPHKQEAKANQAPSKIPDRVDISNDNLFLPIYNPAPP
jgi:hypothetical protein